MLVVTEPGNPIATPASELAELARSIAVSVPIHAEPDPMAALERAWAQQSCICAAGSIFLIGDLLELLGTPGASR